MQIHVMPACLHVCHVEKADRTNQLSDCTSEMLCVLELKYVEMSSHCVEQETRHCNI